MTVVVRMRRAVPVSPTGGGTGYSKALQMQFTVVFDRAWISNNGGLRGANARDKSLSASMAAA